MLNFLLLARLKKSALCLFVIALTACGGESTDDGLLDPVPDQGPPPPEPTVSPSPTFSPTPSVTPIPTTPTPEPAGIPTPSSLEATAIGSDNATLTWSPVADNVDVTEYAIHIDGEWFTTAFSPPVTISPLLPGTRYDLTITALDAAGNASSPSTALTIETLESDVESPPEGIRFFVFSHSLFTFGEFNTGYWLGALANASGTTSAGAGQFGQLSYHAIPPSQDAIFSYPTNAYDPWPEFPSSDFASRDFSHTLFMPSNFEQAGTTPVDYLADTFRVLDFVESEEPDTDIMLYMHWPEPSMLGLTVEYTNQLSDADFRMYNQYTASGPYYDWHVQYQNLIQAQRPAFSIRTIPVGPIIADIIENEPYMSDVNFWDLYTDDAPHGSPTIYFLSAMICYRVMMLQNPSVSYAPPQLHIIPQVANNYDNLIRYIEDRLAYYNSQENGLRVY